jgi:hypothetical protein
MAWASYDGRSIQLGQRIPLRVGAIDREKRFIDFQIAGRPTTDTTHTPQLRVHAKHHKKPQPKPAAHAGPSPTRKKTIKSKHRRR